MLEKSDLVLPDVLPIVLTRTHQGEDMVTRAFGRAGCICTVSRGTEYAGGGVDPAGRGRIAYTCISSSCTNKLTAEYEHVGTPTRFYKSRLLLNSDWGEWQLTLRDGTQYVFEDNVPRPLGLVGVRDRMGNTLTVVRVGDIRTAVGRVTEVKGPEGRWLGLEYDGDMVVQRARDHLGRVVSYTYDGSTRLWKVTDPAGGVTEYTYDSNHRLRTITDARGITFLTNQYDANGRVTVQTQADGTMYQFAYTGWMGAGRSPRPM